MISTRELIKKEAILAGVVLLGFGLHLLTLAALGKALFANQIVWAYAANIALAALILGYLLKAPAKYQNSLGFLFMLGSFLKFAIFFLFFAPLYKSDGRIDNYEFSTFFVPYVLCLILETTLLINKLNRE
jgi:dolichyl-phosphate-mannose--protein O-mannosyl transferase